MTTIVEQQLAAGFGNISPRCHEFVSLPQEQKPVDGIWTALETTYELDPSVPEFTERNGPAHDDVAATELQSVKAEAEESPSTTDSQPESDVTLAKESLSSSTESEAKPAENQAQEPPSTTEPQPSEGPETFMSMLDDIESLGQGRWTDHKEQTIRGPYDYISSAPGKEFRTQLIGGLNLWHRVPPESLGIIANVVRMLHNASLLIDDIQDNSNLRRGRPAAHSVYGVAQTINSANFVYFLALAELQKLRNPTQALEVFTQEMLALHRGQGMDLFWRDTLSCPTEADYLEMVSNKTGGLFRLAVRLMQTESNMGVDCMPLINVIGLIFQIVDDYKNLSDPDYTQKKGYYEDLTEGKFSFPVIHSIHASSGNPVLLNILAQKPTAFEVKRHAVEYMDSTGSLEYTRKFVKALAARAKALAVELDLQCGNDSSSNVILSLVDKMARI
ncbi:Geranylgeranyl pyrophosphate synthase-like protein [Hapsidospora chrysogenum ATCC 11550]|uniref:Geranylgeranyl pyrophosphate synthase-like protein n=1 Tax=Hapsidospora chrysogenum (strain ATCC 11550 / CBS 779.69 / DSM 880 / IAM 14645 / JCM 23072 / IMI 49137) TaxID=857340 RepID=A0A086SXY5_HAPC1|nr:Geranylgeranyl pyrophosphate synthase-like protein [Hapsidospora chrysogenum ATCC 11550]